MVIFKVDHYHTITSFLVSSWVHIFVNSSFCIRNWNVVMIAISRLEIICRPFVIFYKPIFSTMFLIRLEVLIVIISVIISVINNSRDTGIVCKNYNNMVKLTSTFPKYLKWHEYYQVYIMYMFQTFIPISVILLASFGIFLKLNSGNELQISQTVNQRNQIKPDLNSTLEKLLSKNRNSLIPVKSIMKSTATNSTHQIQMKRNSNLKSIRNRRNTTYMVLIFSVIFCLFQSPTFISSCLFLYGESFKFAIHPDVFSNSFNLLDSLSNVFIYAFSSSQFRKFAFSILRNHRSTRQRRSSSLESHKLSLQSNAINN